MERKFLHSLFYKVEKDVCIKTVQQENIGDQKNARKKCQQTGQEIHGRRSEENGENAQKRIWNSMSVFVISSVIRLFWK